MSEPANEPGAPTETAPRATRALLLSSVAVAVAAAGGLAVRASVVEWSRPPDVAPKRTVVLFASPGGPSDTGATTVVVRYLAGEGYGVARQFRDVTPGEPFVLRYEGDRVLGARRLESEPSPRDTPR